MLSPFVTHRSKIVGRYSTALWLRRVVKTLANGHGEAADILKVPTTADAGHAAALEEIMTHYRKVGRDDPELQSLAADLERLEAAEQAADKARRNESL